MDWIPRIFPSFAFLIENGVRLSVHLHLVPVTFTRRCHMARFLGEQRPEECAKPCLRRALLVRNVAFQALGVQLHLRGNAVFRVVQPSQRDLVDLEEHQMVELVLTMNPVTGIDTAGKIDRLVSSLEVSEA